MTVALECMQELFNRPDLPVFWVLYSYVQISQVNVKQERNILPLRHVDTQLTAVEKQVLL